jgi:epoxyqueuosine reductase QueG
MPEMRRFEGEYRESSTEKQRNGRLFTARGATEVFPDRLLEDYHVRVRRALETVARELNELAPCRWRVCVDTAPLPERHLAAEAGLGFIGTNTCLIVPGVGPNVVLGELLVDLEIAPSEPAPRPCARCNRCLRDCPGGALSKDGRLDARRCLSYWTTAAKDAPPDELRAKGGGRFFGCETCVAICPHVGPRYQSDFRDAVAAAVRSPGFWRSPPWRRAVFAELPAWRLTRNQAWAAEEEKRTEP